MTKSNIYIGVAFMVKFCCGMTGGNPAPATWKRCGADIPGAVAFFAFRAGTNTAQLHNFCPAAAPIAAPR